mgnify:CR=1 FL=1
MYNSISKWEKLTENLLNKIEKHIIYDIDIPMENFKNNLKNNFIQLLYYTEGWCKNGDIKEKQIIVLIVGIS